MKNKLFKFRVAFGYSKDGKLRTKILTIEAKDYEAVRAKLEEVYGVDLIITSLEQVNG